MSYTHTSPLRGRQQGLTLIEMMVAMVLGLLLTFGILQVFLSTKNVYRMQADMARIQENGRFAVDILSRDIRMAGYSGCGNIDRVPVNVIAENPGEYMNFDSSTVVGGQDNVAEGNAYQAVAGTDVLSIRGAAAAGVRLYPETVLNANVKIEGNPYGFKKGDTLMVTDCLNADVFNAVSVSNGGNNKVTIAHSQAGNTSNFLSKAYGSDAEIMFFQALTYYIRPSGRTTQGGRSVNSLWLRVQGAGLGSTPQDMEVVEGVEDMQLEYGIDTSGNRAVNQYVTANNVTDWSEVVAVRFSLLLAGYGDNTVTASGPYAQSLSYNGSAVTASGTLRDVFDNTVALRNRLP